MKSKQQCYSPGFLESGLFLVLLLPLDGNVLAQTSFNRWEAQAVPALKSATSAKQRGSQIVLAKARQDSLAKAQQWRNDSLRLVADFAEIPLLRLGIGQRMKEHQLVAEDNNYYQYVGKGIPYPVEALRAQTEGKVVMRLHINAAGQVVGATVVENTIPPGSTGAAAMMRQATFLLRQVRFEPATSSTDEELSVGYKIQ